ncbi:predicted protein [Thalassiosira pseudonana CCMP1335]|uniref:Methyltransferase type 11 domain-containing protein n=1 Tax=Thalassiosira pseudonana TaxID=35128 RepID=B8BU16_THAPS|nr:predicted protein [Thalassiosira pseudonana CCMP1335]EED94685.1 predicted protein [Thalassiosira pseudonana CCMP1335]
MTSASASDDFFQMEKRNWSTGFNDYDLGFGPLTRQAIPTLLAKADFPPSNKSDRGYPYTLLDVATGPGFVLSSAIADLALTSSPEDCESHPMYQLTGLDITENFLTMAKQRIGEQLAQQTNAQSSKINVQFVVGDAEKLSLKFPTNCIDSIICSFGILHLYNPDAFLSEAYRVLRPGGRLSFSAWAPPSRTEGFGITLQSVEEVGNMNVEGLPQGPDFFRFGDTKEAAETMQLLGFEDVQSVELSDMKWTNIKDGGMLYDTLLNGTVRTREILLGQTPEQSVAIQQLVKERYNALTNNGERSLAMPAVVTSGQKPLQ